MSSWAPNGTKLRLITLDFVSRNPSAGALLTAGRTRLQDSILAVAAHLQVELLLGNCQAYPIPTHVIALEKRPDLILCHCDDRDTTQIWTAVEV